MGWNGLSAIVPSNGDWDGDGFPDIFAKLPGGTLVYFKGNGSEFTSRTTIAPGWKSVAVIPPGDFDGDGNIDIIQRTTGGDLDLFPGNGNGTVFATSP